MTKNIDKLLLLLIFFPFICFSQNKIKRVHSMYPIEGVKIGNNNYIGYSTETVNGDVDLEIFSLDSNYQELWNVKYDSGYHDKLLGIFNHQNNIILLNESWISRALQKYELICINNTGDIIWKKAYNEIIIDIVSRGDHGIDMLCVKQKNKVKIEDYHDVNLHFIKLDKNGELLSEKILGKYLPIPRGGTETLFKKMNKMNWSYTLTRKFIENENDSCTCVQPSKHFPFFYYNISIYDELLNEKHNYKINDCSNIFDLFLSDKDIAYYISREFKQVNDTTIKTSNLYLNMFDFSETKKWSKLIKQTNNFSTFDLYSIPKDKILITISEQDFLELYLFNLEGDILMTKKIQNSIHPYVIPQNNKICVVWKYKENNKEPYKLRFEIIDFD